ncbi:Uncharacterised protein [Gordonia paraffinivorans]|uniref:Uncharacterized protein n=1 Tax=Gordonia paraffinivorans TaxID=175628 RepID=A0ABD7V7L2_9ACTN|nr:hypothetical protein [Gordonia paraffinivorans]VFA90394.1 Uncharacterised protein [Gordonia paraffinivorans]
MIRPLAFRLLLTVALGILGCLIVFVPATARSTPPASPTPVRTPSTPPPQSGPEAEDRVSITFVSDRQHNGAAAWSDATGNLRTQTHVPLLQRDSQSGLWSAALVFTRHSPDAPLHAVFRSGGRFARCEVRVNDRLVAEDSAHGDHPTSTCQPNTNEI